MFYIDKISWNQSHNVIFILSSIFILFFIITMLFACFYDYSTYMSFDGMIIIEEKEYGLECYIPIETLEKLDTSTVEVANQEYRVNRMNVSEEIQIDATGKKYQRVQVFSNWNDQMKVENIHLYCSFQTEKQTLFERWKNTWQKGEYDGTNQ